jgi:hypothetical protein
MNISLILKASCLSARTRAVSWVGAVAILALTILLAIGSAQAAGSSSGILLAANEAHGAEAAQTEAGKTDTQVEKKEAAKAP